MIFLVLAQLSSDEIGVLRLALGLLTTGFATLVGWVAVYMRRQAERVEKHVTDIALLTERLEDLRKWRDEHRMNVHKIPSFETWQQHRERETEDFERRLIELERHRP